MGGQYNDLTNTITKLHFCCKKYIWQALKDVQNIFKVLVRRVQRLGRL